MAGKWLLGHKGVTGDQLRFLKGKVPGISTQVTEIIKLRQCGYLGSARTTDTGHWVPSGQSLCALVPYFLLVEGGVQEEGETF